MRFTETADLALRGLFRALCVVSVFAVVACSSPQRAPEPAALPKPDWIPFPPNVYPPPPVPPAVVQTPAAVSWEAYRMRAAQRITAMNAAITYSGPAPEPLASIPVLQIQLRADGSVANIEVLRVPKFEPKTVEMAKAAVMRAAPFGPVGNLPRPWQFNETFLYNDELKFKLRTLEEGQ